MAFKLVRVDSAEPYRVALPLGSHFIGRGKFLGCNDNRVSRNHAELIVTSDSILIKSLHQNPCFVKKKSSSDTLIISIPESQVLTNGDQFGLIPNNFWYEVIYHSEDSQAGVEFKEAINKSENKDKDENVNHNGESRTQSYEHQPEENDANNICSQSVLGEIFDAPFSISQERQASQLNTENNLKKQNEVLVKTAELPDQSYNHNTESTDENGESTNENVEPIERVASTTHSTTPSKREHPEDDSPYDVKRIKTEPEHSVKKDDDSAKIQLFKTDEAAVSMLDKIIKSEPSSPDVSAAGPSSFQAGPSSTNDPPVPGAPQSPIKPANKQLRERCMYGTNCYRRNPQHKAQFSHPADADWGAGPQGECPWGAACSRTDPRHWRDHQHPPGVQPPQQGLRGNRQGMQLVRRNGNIFYINANCVHFHDDHFEVEDSDGDSVDYDYEF